MNFKQHPLPWKAAIWAGDRRWHVVDAKGQAIATYIPRDIAHLIAACPELYQSLNSIRAKLVVVLEEGGHLDGDDLESTTKAIAKANGEPQRVFRREVRPSRRQHLSANRHKPVHARRRLRRNRGREAMIGGRAAPLARGAALPVHFH